MGMSTADQMKLANEIGYEAHRLILKRLEVMGEASFSEIFQAVTLASEVCLANALAPAIQRAPDRASAADSLISTALKQVRGLVEPVVKANS